MITGKAAPPVSIPSPHLALKTIPKTKNAQHHKRLRKTPEEAKSGSSIAHGNISFRQLNKKIPVLNKNINTQ
jgi:hypothetical protein